MTPLYLRITKARVWRSHWIIYCVTLIFCRVICVNDGSTDNTEAVMAEVKRKWGDRFVAVTQKKYR